MLHEREMPTGVYEPRLLKTRLLDGSQVMALAFVAKRDHVQYFRLTETEAAFRIRHGQGEKGRAFDYLESTLTCMDELDIHDAKLKRILRLAA